MELTPESRKIEIGQESLNHLNTSRKWAMFIAIMGFILLGLLILAGLIAGTFMSAFSSGAKTTGETDYLMTGLFIIVAIVYFLPVVFLFRFSKHTAHAVQTLNNKELYKAIRNLRSYFVYIGILIILVLSFYIGLLIVSGTSIAFLKGF